jgi:ferrous iron transport protein A
MASNGILLQHVAKGSRLIIVDIPDRESRARLIRFGIVSGEVVYCLERLPGGTVVIQKDRQEIGIGTSLAKTILVTYAGPDDHYQPMKGRHA